MGKRVITTRTEEVPDEEQPVIPVPRGRQHREPLPSFEDEEAIDNITSRFQGEGEIKFKLYRIVTGGNEFCGILDDLDESDVQENYGEGNYLAKLFVNGVFRKPFKFRIAPRKRGNPSDTGNGVAMSPIEKMILDQNAKLMQLIESKLLSGQQRSDVGELIEGMKGLQQLTGGPREGSVDLFLKGLEMGRTLSDGDKGGGGWTDVVKDALPSILGFMNSGGAALNGNGHRQLPTKTEGAPVNSEREQLAPLIGYLKAQALAGVDPEALIHIAVANRGNTMYQGLLSYVLNNTWETIQGLDPELSQEPHATYFRALTDGLRSAIQELDSVAAHSERPIGDNRDASGNADAGKKRSRSS